MPNDLLRYLPIRISRAVAALPERIAEGLTEIRLRAGGPVSVTSGGRNHTFTESGLLCPVERALRCCESELEECVALLSRSSLYSFGDTVKNGYIPFGDGCRAGVCGEGIVQNGETLGFRKIHSVNLRQRRFIRDFGLEAAKRVSENGLKGALVYSPPGFGKTTLLRSVAALLSDGSLGRAYRVALADERGELFVPELAAGLTDAVRGLKKAEAARLLCRSMSPEVLICDELSPEDAGAMTDALNTGVCVIASAHADSVSGLKSRPFIAKLLETGAFPLLIGIGEGFRYRVEERGELKL